MTARPRSPDQRLFDSAVLTRGVWQGTGLLLLLLATFAGVRSATASEDTARAATFVVLVLSNLGLIQANQDWRHAAWDGLGRSNRFFAWIAIAAVILLACVLSIPSISRLFAFVRPTPHTLLAAIGMAVASFLWFQSVTWAFGRWSSDRKKVGPAR